MPSLRCHVKQCIYVVLKCYHLTIVALDTSLLVHFISLCTKWKKKILMLNYIHPDPFSVFSKPEMPHEELRISRSFWMYASLELLFYRYINHCICPAICLSLCMNFDSHFSSWIFLLYDNWQMASPSQQWAVCVYVAFFVSLEFCCAGVKTVN